MSNRFTKADRLVHKSDFERVYESDLFAADRFLVIKGLRNGQSRSRLGLSVSRRVGNAVARNRWKRAIREAFRTRRDKIPDGWDFVVRPRKGAQLDRSAIARSLVYLTRRIDKQERPAS